MASGGLIITSNTKVFKEILNDKKNCIMVNNLNSKNWKKIITGLDKKLIYINNLKRNAYNDSKEFTYLKRARKIINFKL